MRFPVPSYATAIVSRTKNKIGIDVEMIHFVEGEDKLYRIDVMRIDNLWLIGRAQGLTEKQFGKVVYRSRPPT